jgi:hypothetical protein
VESPPALMGYLSKTQSLLKTKCDPRNHTKRHEADALAMTRPSEQPVSELGDTFLSQLALGIFAQLLLLARGFKREGSVPLALI